LDSSLRAAQLPESELEGGVAVIETGRILGGDSGYAYVGTVDASGQHVSDRIRSIRHNRAVESVYGRDEDEFELSFKGMSLSHERIEGELHRPGFPSGRFVFTRLVELP
jgi:hypothetical protein